jgi:beta-glucosidase
MTASSEFPAGFLWGTATAAYQIEGSPLAEGAGPSIWHRFAHTPGRTARGETGDEACDHYHRWRDDVRLMAERGLNAYRFSISWSRLLPDGTGAVNANGVAFYDRLIDALLEHGITPLVTLYHWDLPAALDDRGGWLNRDIAAWFGDYAVTAFRAYGDRVPRWVTLNEPWVVTDGGYLHGALAPGHSNLYESPIASHNLLRAHGNAVQAYLSERSDQLGLVVNLEPKTAATSNPADQQAARRADAYMNRQNLDPVYLGRYPEELAGIFGDAWPDFPQDDFALIQAPTDFLGINYYTRGVSQHDPAAWPVHASNVRQPGALYTETGWEVHPESLTTVLLWVTERYGRMPIYITENGAAFPDPPTATGDTLDDPLRVAYYQSHLLAAREAIDQGVDLRGYCAWSLLDNFEWSLGYSKRFGIVHVDYATQKRTPKASARFYAEVARSNGASLSDPAAAP